MIKENVDRVHKILKRSAVIIVEMILPPNRLETFDVKTGLIASDRNVLQFLSSLMTFLSQFPEDLHFVECSYIDSEILVFS